MIAAWLGLILTVALTSPDAVAAGLGEPSWYQRETLQTAVAILAASETPWWLYRQEGEWTWQRRFWWRLELADSNQDVEVRKRVMRAIDYRNSRVW